MMTYSCLISTVKTLKGYRNPVNKGEMKDETGRFDRKHSVVLTARVRMILITLYG